jgi:hypothetical protein
MEFEKEQERRRVGVAVEGWSVFAHWIRSLVFRSILDDVAGAASL